MWLADLEALRPELAAWNHANQRAMDDYHANPRAACRTFDGVGDQRTPCDLLTDAGDPVCPKHMRERGKAVVRMRGVRLAKRVARAADQRRYRERNAR